MKRQPVHYTEWITKLKNRNSVEKTVECGRRVNVCRSGGRKIKVVLDK